MNDYLGPLVCIAIPTWAAVVVWKKIHICEKPPWQTLACFTVLISLATLSALLLSSSLTSVEIAGTKISAIDDRIETIETVRQQTQRIAELNARIAARFDPGFFKDWRAMFNYYDSLHKNVRALLDESQLSKPEQQELLSAIEKRREEALSLMESEKQQ